MKIQHLYFLPNVNEAENPILNSFILLGNDINNWFPDDNIDWNPFPFKDQLVRALSFPPSYIIKNALSSYKVK